MCIRDSHWTSLGWNGLNGRSTWNAPADNGERFSENHGHLLKPWRKKDGYALIMGQVRGDAALSDVVIDHWYLKIAAEMQSCLLYTSGSQPAITPWQQEDPNAEWFLVAAGSNAFRDFSQSDEVKQANREARAREGSNWEKNPIFRSGDIILDGCVVTEVPEIDTILGPSLATAGANSARLSPVFLMGCLLYTSRCV